ncbi:BMP family ABC transporter substrate-binding protein [Nocardioides sp. zg-578]|uniref:BMP family ABC transporter substrate-binding protein n=2 Tax=Nocardioides marmotae TaxID=2663857 RepID=A0A6I3J9V9_9ACTN|nr:BMP family ABC transporter substrate-binding protein [Nocardioides marmotae]MCR6031321.1 BMP family ABC transporter substrate-binding protein [Gordonia jinghuaiqii]MBC9733659.1 BMP family ABC transporter substrate-binding protein [Nocardioides marmotae]MTB84762.1 BMP family ABC transporter substrate-binding protein [Nocardioides marmotae]MTB94960.1 BMP family ABC transporter substrate-binding protein [Nocardioides marmotae]QKE02530.1 BMP family ABC transporter substrate-binding protein [Noc
MAMVAGLVALSLTACGERDSDDNASEPASSAPTTEATSEAPSEQFPDFKACIVSDSGGFDDKSFNQTSYAGLTMAAEDYGVQTAEVESNAPSEFNDNINEMVQQGCNIVTTVGFLLADATEAAAKKNKDVDFAIVDSSYEKPLPNVKGLTFNTAEPSFLAGYLAAAKSETGTVGTFGGVNIPTVTIFMDGFYQGVQKYNEDEGADVQVIGWNPETEEGSFTNDFENKTLGQSTAEEMITQGADVIFPVAGPAGLGGLQAAQDNDVKAIWVDTDGCESAAEYCDVLLTSVVKAMDVAVEQAILESAEGTFTNEPYLGTLENNGVGLAPYGPEADVDDELASKIDELKQQIIDGEITVTVK